MTRSIIKNKSVRIWLAVLFWLGVWELAALFVGDELLLSSPLTVVRSLSTLIVTAEFWSAIGFSALRIIGGFLLALIIGILLAILAAQIPAVRTLLSPLILFIKSTPVASFIILALLWISSRNLSLFISFLMVLPIVYTNILEGILATDRGLLEMARMYHIPLPRRLLYLYLPSVMPQLIAACTVGLGLCWKSGIAAEVIGLPGGSIGEKLYQAKIFLATGELFAWTAVIILVSVCFEKIVLALLRRGVRALEERSGRV